MAIMGMRKKSMIPKNMVDQQEKKRPITEQRQNLALYEGTDNAPVATGMIKGGWTEGYDLMGKQAEFRKKKKKETLDSYLKPMKSGQQVSSMGMSMNSLTLG